MLVRIRKGFLADKESFVGRCIVVDNLVYATTMSVLTDLAILGGNGWQGLEKGARWVLDIVRKGTKYPARSIWEFSTGTKSKSSWQSRAEY